MKISIFPKIIFGAQEAQIPSKKTRKVKKRDFFEKNVVFTKNAKKWYFRTPPGIPKKSAPIDHFLIRLM